MFQVAASLRIGIESMESIVEFLSCIAIHSIPTPRSVYCDDEDWFVALYTLEFPKVDYLLDNNFL